MLWTFILGVAAGWGAPMAEEHLRGLLKQVLSAEDISAVELRAISLAVCLLIAAIIAMALGSGGAFALTLGAVLGVLGPRLYDRLRAMRAPDYDS